jgi:hypothetical protein
LELSRSGSPVSCLAIWSSAPGCVVDADLQTSPPAVSPGSKCPTCERRVPHPKKPTSPNTRVFSLRIPVSNVENFKEMLEATSAHLALLEKPHSAYWTIIHGLVLSLQGPSGEES